jgi:hypothetical protein
METESRQLLKILIIALAIFLVGMPNLRVVADADIVYPTPVTQSAFMKSYSPASTIARFSIEGSGGQQSAPGASSAGRGCAFHDKEFRSWFVIASGNGPAVMADAQRDIRTRLTRDGGQIVTESGKAPDRFQFDYRAGKDQGSVVVEPIVVIDPVLVEGPGGLPPGEVAVELRIRITETWYKTLGKTCRKI